MTNEEPTRERKERVLHTRISEQLAEDIRAIADDLRVPVSNLVRNVLEEAFDAVERVSGDVSQPDGRRDRRGRAREPALPPLPRSRARAGAARARRRREPQRQRVRERRSRRCAGSADPLAPRGGVAAGRAGGAAAAARAPGRELRPGERAYLGLGDTGPLGIYVAESAIERPA